MERCKHGEGIHFSGPDLRVVAHSLHGVRVLTEHHETKDRLTELFESAEAENSRTTRKGRQQEVVVVVAGVEEIIVIEAIKQYSESHFDSTEGLLAAKIIDDYEQADPHSTQKYN